MVCLRSCRRFSHTIVTTTITRMANSMARAATAVASPGTSGHPVSAFPCREVLLDQPDQGLLPWVRPSLVLLWLP